MEERRSCYFCTSPFQLFAIISIAKERNEKADLYIDPQFSGADIFADRIRHEGIFENVIVIDSKTIYDKYIKSGPGLINHLQIAASYCHVKAIAEMILIPNVRYQVLFVSSKAYLPRMVQLYYIKKKWEYSIYYFDDGAGTYCEDRAYKIKKTDRLVRKLLFGKKATDVNKCRYVFSPEVYKELNKQDKNEIKGIVKYWETQNGKQTMNRIFDVTDDLIISERLIILDQPKEELFSTNQQNDIGNIYLKCAKHVGKGNVILKKHPRSDDKNTLGFKCFKNPGIPFEMYCLNQDISEKVIICYSSTAAATPKILFNQEPLVIVLCKLINPITGDNDLFFDYFQAVKNSYVNPERILIPDNQDQLEGILARL